ncbi:MAG TPA: acyl-CoA-binding protein [Intrasporangiaceae bacterium]|nr:acyl-CoA-binding protein [Intrasporangiaceae bacterium]
MSEFADFDAAVADVQSLTKDPGNEVKLKLYALYKQATEGDVTGKRPGFTNPVGRAKYDAWATLKGANADDARAHYVAIVEDLKAREA